MVSIFGESVDDKRDKILGLAGLTAGIQSLRILAERGLASADDIELSVDGIKSVLAQLPSGSLEAVQLERLDAILDAMVEVSRGNFRGNT